MGKESKNFRNGKVPTLQSVYLGYSFCFDQPLLVDGSYKPNRIFPGDDTPRVFVKCNLVNAMPPPNSTLVRCNTSIIERDIPTAEINNKGDPVFECVVHGRTNPITLANEQKAKKARIRQ